MNSIRVGEIAEKLGCELEGDASIEIERPAPIEAAEPGTLTFVANDRYAKHLPKCRASAIVLGPGSEAPCPAILRANDPYGLFVRVLELFHEPLPTVPGVHPTAVIAASATVGEGASIGPYVVIGEGVTIGAQARIDAHVCIYAETTIGARFRAFANVTVRERVTIGDDVVLQSGAVIGGDGFGYIPDPERIVKPIPQIGTVVLEDAVEIGCNSTVDRATVGETRIKRGAKIDNLVMVSHGSSVGEFSFLAAQVGMAGSTRIGAGVQLGGQVGIAGHLTVGDGVRAQAQSGISNDIEPGTVLGGVVPAFEIGRWRRSNAVFRRLPELVKRVAKLEKLLAKS